MGKEGDEEEKVWAQHEHILEEEIFHLLVCSLQRKGVCRFQREGGRFLAEMYGTTEDFREFLLGSFRVFAQGRWQIELERKSANAYELSVRGEGG